MAIITDSITFSYNKYIKALNNVSINVPYGNIYSILGPSGCGKTTLLNIILGYYKPDNGNVFVFNKRPGRCLNHKIGYMPQELGLSPLLPIRETFYYFARVNHVNDENYICEQIEYYLKILSLNDSNRRLSELSMGQKRLLSLGVILISKPKLLLLDEPTVGIDSMIRQQIWNHLRYLCQKDNITVILTTHYIDEARESNIVSFLRDGRLLMEESPKYLLKKLNCNTLEEVFSYLCMIDLNKLKLLSTKNDDDEKLSTIIQYENNNSKDDDENFTITKCSNENLNFDHLKALFYRDYFLFTNNLLYFLIYLIIPILTLYLVGIVFSNGLRSIPIAIYNNDNFIVDNNLNNDNNNNYRISDLFINEFNSTMVVLNHYQNETEAEKSIELGLNQILISFHSNFSQSFIKRYIDNNNNNNINIDYNSNIHLYFDYTNLPNIMNINNSILVSLQRTIQKFFDMRGLNSQAFTVPIVQREIIYGKNTETMLNFLFTPSFFFTQFLTNLAKSSFEIIHLNDFGCLNRDIIQGIRSLELIIQFLLSSILLSLIQLIIMMIFVFGLFQFPIVGDYLSVFLILFPITIQGLLTGTLIAIIVTNKMAILFLSIGITLALGLTSGIFWPTESWPQIWQFIAKFHPWTLSLKSLQSIIIRGWHIQNIDVFYGCTIGILYCLLFILMAILIFQYKNKRFN